MVARNTSSRLHLPRSLEAAIYGQILSRAPRVFSHPRLSPSICVDSALHEDLILGPFENISILLVCPAGMLSAESTFRHIRILHSEAAFQLGKSRYFVHIHSIAIVHGK